MIVEEHILVDGLDFHGVIVSDDRARAVRDYLIGKGVPAARLRAQGFGQTHPIADNKSVVGREKNRRADFFIDRDAP